MIRSVVVAGAQYVRSAGASCILLEKNADTNYAVLKMPSKEERRFLLDCMATIGVVSNSEHKFVKLGKAGRSRWLGRRPTVRGVAMNPVWRPSERRPESVAFVVVV